MCEIRNVCGKLYSKLNAHDSVGVENFVLQTSDVHFPCMKG